MHEIKITEMSKDERFCEFRVEETHISIANALRRVMIAEIPTIAIELVTVEQNTSVLNDEFIAHRLGLVPLDCHEVNMKSFRRRPECDCEDMCDMCSVVFSLGVKNNDPHPIFVTTDMLVSNHPSVRPVKYKQPIVIAKLGANQEIRLKAVAVKGISKEHAKWSPVATVAMKAIPDVTINQDVAKYLTAEECKEFVAVCPTKVYKYNQTEEKIEIEDMERCVYCDECVYKAEHMNRKDLVVVRRKRGRYGNNHFRFRVETTGALTASQIVLTATQILQHKLKRVREGIEHAHENQTK